MKPHFTGDNSIIKAHNNNCIKHQGQYTSFNHTRSSGKLILRCKQRTLPNNLSINHCIFKSHKPCIQKLIKLNS